MRTKRKPLAVVGLLALSLATPGSAQTKANQSTGTRASSTSVPMPKTDRMSMATFQSLLAKGKVVVIDVRSSDSYAAGHIPGALSIPEESINSVTAEKLIRMGKAIATYCTWQAEHTSARAAQTLQRMGVPAQAIVGGMTLWVDQKNPLKVGNDAK